MDRINNSGEYSFITLLYKKYGSTAEFRRPINRKISTRKNGAFHFKYSMEQSKIYISYAIDNEMDILNDNLRDILGFKRNIVNGRSAESNNEIERGYFCRLFARLLIWQLYISLCILC